MRPKSIVTFERVVLLGLALGILNAFLVWDQAITAASAQGLGGSTAGNVIIGTQVVMVLLYLLLIYFIARKGSPVAKWIYVVLTVLGLVLGLIGIQQTFAYGTVPMILTVVQYLLSIYSLYLLFRPDSNAWFSDGRGGEVDPEVFR